MGLRCEHCHEIIGMYEPMLAILRDGSERTGSRLTLRDELHRPGSVALHEHCLRRRATEPPRAGEDSSRGLRARRAPPETR